MNLEKPREVFLYNELIYKNRSHILHNYYGLRITGGVLKPIFFVNGFQTKRFFICNRFGNERTHCLYKC
jgi:hypothetical protein